MAAKLETVDTGSTFGAGSNTLKFANYLAYGTGEDNVYTEMTEVSTSVKTLQSKSTSMKYSRY